MAYSYAESTASGSTAIFTVPFEYISKAYIHVSVNGVLVDDALLTWNSSTEIVLPTTPAAGATVRRFRTTPKTPLVTFQSGDLSTDDLNLFAKQCSHLVQEATDTGDTIEAALAAVSAAIVSATSASSSALAAAETALEAAEAASVFDPSSYLSKSGNLSGLADKAAARGNLGLATVAASGTYGDLAGKPTLGTAAPKDVGTGAGNVVALDADGKLPAVPGDRLTGIKTITAVPAIALSGQMSALFTGIPSDARRLTLQLNAVSTITDASNTYIRLGTAGALVTSGYSSGACGLGYGVGGGYGAAGDGSGIYLLNVPANEMYTGIVTLTRVGTTNTWLSSYVFSRNLGAIVVAGGGGVTLPGPIDRLSLVSLSYAFDNGAASLLVE